MEKHLIKQILFDQKDEIKKILSNKIIQREVQETALKLLPTKLIKVIMGVRRCGKSVLAHLILDGKNYGYVNFDDERLLAVKSTQLNDILEILKEITPEIDYLFFDEIQNVEGWELFINRLKRNNYNLIISGSNSKLLSSELATHLTGRHCSIELFPFSFREYLVYNNYHFKEDDFYITEKRAELKRLLENYMQQGGLPEAFMMEDEAGRYLRELYVKLITRDIILRYNVRYGKDLKDMALYIVSNFGSRISLHKIKNTLAMKSVHTVKNYLDYLTETYLVFQVNGFSAKVKEQLRQPKKIYCIDSGLINAIVPKMSMNYGRLMENLVFIELMRQEKEIYFYHGISCEVDFLIKEGLKINQLIQVCYSIDDIDTKKRELKALIKAACEFGCRNLTIITWDTETEEKINPYTIKIIPLWKWLIQLASAPALHRQRGVSKEDAGVFSHKQCKFKTRKA